MTKFAAGMSLGNSELQIKTPAVADATAGVSFYFLSIALNAISFR